MAGCRCGRGGRRGVGRGRVDRVRRRGRVGILADNLEEHVQIMRVGPHRVQPAPPRRELQEFIHELVTKPVAASSIAVDRRLQRPGWLDGHPHKAGVFVGRASEHAPGPQRTAPRRVRESRPRTRRPSAIYRRLDDASNTEHVARSPGHRRCRAPIESRSRRRPLTVPSVDESSAPNVTLDPGDGVTVARRRRRAARQGGAGAVQALLEVTYPEFRAEPDGAARRR